MAKKDWIREGGYDNVWAERKKNDTRPLFYGVNSVRITWRGEWADPEVSYQPPQSRKVYAISYYELEAILWDEFQDEYHSSDEELFAQWVKKNPRRVKFLIKELVGR